MNNTKIVKKIFIAIIIISFLSSFNNYTNSSQNLDDQAYVMAIGVDKGQTAKFKITFQISALESSATEASTKSSASSEDNNNQSNASGSSESSKYEINTVEADSLDTAINIVDAYLNKHLDLSHCKILLLSEELAKKRCWKYNKLINK